MKHLMKALAIGSALAALAPLAHATTIISIGLQESTVNGGAVTNVANDGGIGSVSTPSNYSYGAFVVNSVSGLGYPDLSQGSLDTSSINVSSTSGGTITVYITEQGLTSPTGASNFVSTFTSNAFNGAVTSVVESTLYSSSDSLFAGATMKSRIFTDGNDSPPSLNTLETVGTTYSETAEYVITTTGAANVNDTIDLTAASAATPEPSSLILLGTGVLGAAGMLRRRFAGKASA